MIKGLQWISFLKLRASSKHILEDIVGSLGMAHKINNLPVDLLVGQLIPDDRRRALHRRQQRGRRRRELVALHFLG